MLSCPWIRHVREEVDTMAIVVYLLACRLGRFACSCELNSGMLVRIDETFRSLTWERS